MSHSNTEPIKANSQNESLLKTFLFFFIENNRFAYLVMLALIGFGLLAISEIPKESAPDIQIPIGVVSTALPGASATDVASLVTDEIERRIDGNLSDVKQITSQSREGLSIVTVEFESTADIDDSIRSLRDEMSIVRSTLPDDATEPFVSDVNFVDQPILTFSVSGERTDETFIELADELKTAIEDIDGVSEVSVSGVRNKQVQVIVDRVALQNFNLTISNITTTLRQAESAVPIGEIVSDNVTYGVVFENKLTSVDDIRNLPLQSDIRALTIGDVAIVTEGTSPQDTFSRLSIAGETAQTSLTFNVSKRRTAEVITVNQAVLTQLDDFFTNNPNFKGLEKQIIVDQAEVIRDELVELSTSGLQTAALVTLLLVIALGWREGFIAGLSIPLSFTIGFIGLWLSGNTINFISLFALILGIGILVDSSIVMVEGINKKMKDDPTIDKVQAAKEIIVAFAKPVTAGTLTTVAMFSGLFVVGGITGQFIASIPFTLIFILLASLLVAIGFIPLISASILKRRSTTVIEQKQQLYAKSLEIWYTNKIRSFLESRKKKVVFVSTLLVGFFASFALIPLGLVQVVFFGQGNADNIFIDIELPAGSSTFLTDIIVRQIEEVLYDTEEIVSFTSTIGTGNAFIGSSNSGGNVASIIIELESGRERSNSAIRSSLRQSFNAIQGAEITLTQPEAGPPTGSPVAIQVSGTDSGVLTEAAQIVASILRDIPHTDNVNNGVDTGNNEFVFTPDRLLAARLGVTLFSVSELLRATVSGSEARTIIINDEEIPVIVRLNESGSNSVDDMNNITIEALENLTIPSQTGDNVILDSVIDTSLRDAQSTINRVNRQEVITVTAGITAEGNVRNITQEFQTIINETNPLPESVSFRIAGETEESDQGFADLFLALIVGVVLMIGILVLQFNSYRYPLYVLSIVPFSLMGILYGLAIVGSPLSFPSIMGFIALTGIVVNNSILLIDVINNERKNNPNIPVRDIVVSGSASRMRPILLTTITTVLGITPLLFSDPIWIPFATAIMFGLSFSVVITLILVPIIYDKFPGKIR